MAAEGAQLYYRVIGSGQDTIVVVHGGPGAGMHSVLPSFEPLARKYVLIFYDQRGGGRSTLPADTTKLAAEYFIEDLEAVRKHFGLATMNVITHSFGAILVAQYATKYPDRLERMVFHGATGPRRAEAAERARAATSTASPDTAISNRAAELLHALLSGTAADPVAACREFEALGKQIALARDDTVTYRGTTCTASAEAVRYYYRYTAQLAPRSFGDWNFTTGLEQVSAPLLVVYGARDTLALPAQREWANAVHNGRFLPVPEAGKSAITDHPEFVFPAIETFFSGDWPQAAEMASE